MPESKFSSELEAFLLSPTELLHSHPSLGGTYERGGKSMTMATYVIVTILTLGLLGLGLQRVGGTFFRYRGKRVITCPQTKQPAAVELAAMHAALTAVFRHPALQLRECSRWPERRNCGQECLKQIEAAPDDCLVRTILTKWCQGKSCTYCGKPLGEINWKQHKPGLVSPELQIFEWKNIRPETVPYALEAYSPVCWNCYIAETHTS
jgi:hypothetical protein